jgi:hypothetical protein
VGAGSWTTERTETTAGTAYEEEERATGAARAGDAGCCLRPIEVGVVSITYGKMRGEKSRESKAQAALMV